MLLPAEKARGELAARARAAHADRARRRAADEKRSKRAARLLHDQSTRDEIAFAFA
jgi:hypothetical protein